MGETASGGTIGNSRILAGIERHLFPNRGQHVDSQPIGLAGEVDEHIGDLVGHLGLHLLRERLALFGGEPLEMLEQFGGLDH
jgi:hypothetical protein